MRIKNEKIACLSDLHIGLHQSSHMWLNISLEFGRWLKQELIDRDIKDIIIPGDILDDRDQIAVPTLHLLPQFFKILEPFNIIITVGNHDCYYNKRSDVHSLAVLNDWENITVIDKVTTITAHEKIITFCPWHPNMEEVPKSDIIFGHFDIQTFKMNGFKICERGIKPRDLLDKGELIITGHYHMTQERPYKNGKILYLGSPYEQNWGEANTPKGFYILDVPSLQYEFVENTISPKHRKIKLSELFAVGSITEDIRKEFNGNIVKFIVDKNTKQQAVDGLVAKFKLLKPIELRVEYEYVRGYDADNFHFEALGVDIENDMIDFVKKLDFIEKKDDILHYLDDIYNRAERLLK